MALINLDKISGLVAANKLKKKDITHLSINIDGSDKAIILQKQPGPPTKQKRHNQGWWPENKKVEAATLYAATGSIPRTSELAKVPLQTLRRWLDEEWFLQTMHRVKREENFEVDRRFSKIVDKALTKIEERIEGGDYVYDIKRGVAAPVPMSGRDLAIVTGTVFDKRQLLRGEATKISAAVNSEEHLKKLAADFVKFVEEKRHKKEIVIEGEVDDNTTNSRWLPSGQQAGQELRKEQKQARGSETSQAGGVVQEAH